MFALVVDLLSRFGVDCCRSLVVLGGFYGRLFDGLWVGFVGGLGVLV